MKYELFEYEDETIFRWEADVDLPTKVEVCDRCQGKGTHTNPSIDGNGISAEEFDEDPDFAEDYLSGVYDIICEVCNGRNVVEIVDESRIPQEYKKQYEATEKARHEFEAEEAAHRRACDQGWGW